MRKKIIAVSVIVLVVVCLAVAGALLLSNLGNGQNTVPNDGDNTILGGVGGNGGDGGFGEGPEVTPIE